LDIFEKVEWYSSCGANVGIEKFYVVQYRGLDILIINAQHKVHTADDSLWHFCRLREGHVSLKLNEPQRTPKQL